MPGREYIELGNFGVFEDGVLTKKHEKVEEVVKEDEDSTVEETDPEDTGKEEDK